jgi:leader peptidase (prepilin peptidase) / N-methyltransferase
MSVFILFIGLITGLLLDKITSKVLAILCGHNDKEINVLIVLICGLCFSIFYLKFQLSTMFFIVITLASLLIIISFVDFKTKIIPNFMVAITFGLGVIFAFTKGGSITDSILGMLVGGGVLFILALIPNAMGGGDIKLMFALGTFLGLQKTLWAIMFAFIIASIISLLLLMFKVIGRKDHIPFGPFLALGSIISLMIFI